MDNGGRNSPTSDQSQKELSISFAASSMINASDMITAEAYQANLQRIQEVREMVRRLEMNNEAAHKNFLVDQLEKRAKDGREAEDMLVRLRSQPEITETVQFTTNVPSDNSEVILPTTATLVEVPESHSSLSYSSPAPTATYHPPQTIHQGGPAKYQWSLPPEVHQVQSYHPDVFRYYVPPHTVRQSPQHSATPLPQAPVDAGQIRRYVTQNVPPQPSVRSPLAYQTGFQQPSQPWSGYPPQVIALPAVGTLPAPGYHASPAGWVRTVPAQGGSSTGSSNPTCREPGLPMPSPVSPPPLTTHNQSQSLQSFAPTSQVQIPLQGASVVPVTSAQPPSTRSHSKPAESQLQPVSTAVSKPVAISELPRPHKQPHQLQHQPQQPQRLPQPPLQPQRHSQQPQTLHQQQTQRPPQPLLQLQQHSQQPQTQLQRLPRPMQQPQQLPQQSQAQFSSQPPQAHLHLPSQSADRARSTGAPQPSQPTNVQEQAQQRGPQPRMDQAAFIKLFQVAIQRDTLQFKAFWFQAKAAGISDEWFIAAINSLPRDLWQSVMARANQSEPIVNTPPTASAPQQQRSPIPSPNVPVVSAQLPPTAIPPVHSTPAAQQATKPSASTEGRTTYLSSAQASAQYAAQLQYYAGQATKSALSAQVASTSTTSSENIAMTQIVLATPKRDAPQVRANVRTPKDANKSTLARDILRSLGKIIPKPHQGTGDEPTDQVNNRGGDQPREVTASQPVSRAASPKPPAVPPATSIVDANSPSIPSAKPNIQDEPQRVTSPGPSTVLKEEHRQAAVVGGPIMIDLTLEDSDESVDGNGQEPTFSIQTSATAATPLQPASATNTTNHTPLLESLSLEESPAEVAADGDNADVRMHSPPLSFATEENMKSELLCPPPVSAEPVSPSFEPPPHEASELPLDGKLPLFLPSPPISPAHSKPSETDLEMIVDESKSRPSLKRCSVDVDEMENTMLVTPRASKRRKQQVYVLIPPAPYMKKAKLRGRAIREGIDLDLDGVGADEEFRYSHLEQLLIEESKSRLLERRCRWSNCGAILNCAANLLAHIKNHVREEELQAPFLCRWASCQRQFGVEQERDVHLERHAIRPLPCPFAGCDEQFDKPVEVMQHEVQHQKADLREPLIHKPTCQPIVPAIPARLGPPPHRLPSHRTIPKRVLKCRISADRHAIVGPWVLWNIWSPVDLNMRKQNASMRSRPTRQAIDYDIDSSDPRRDDYDFLLALSSYPAKNPQLDDLDSTLVTMSAARGLTLWGTGSTVNSAAGFATPEEHTNAASITLAVDAAVPSSATEDTRVDGPEGTEVTPGARGDSIPEERRSGQSMGTGEEDAVERMLIL